MTVDTRRCFTIYCTRSTLATSTSARCRRQRPLAEQAAYSRKGVDRLVEEACSTARTPCQRGEPGFSECANINTIDERFEGLDHYIDHHNDQELRRLGSMAVKRRLAKDGRRRQGSPDDGRGSTTSGVWWPLLADLRTAFEQRHGAQTWLDPDRTEWD